MFFPTNPLSGRVERERQPLQLALSYNAQSGRVHDNQCSSSRYRIAVADGGGTATVAGRLLTNELPHYEPKERLDGHQSK